MDDEKFKTLTLDYDYLDNEYFELYVIDDRTIELYHANSGTGYKFHGKGYLQHLKSGKGTTTRKRGKSKLPIMNVVRKRK